MLYTGWSVSVRVFTKIESDTPKTECNPIPNAEVGLSHSGISSTDLSFPLIPVRRILSCKSSLLIPVPLSSITKSAYFCSGLWSTDILTL